MKSKMKLVVVIIAATILPVAVPATRVLSQPSGPSESSDALQGMTIDHVMVNVSDFDRSVRWYEEKLGFEKVVQWTVEGLDGTRLGYLKRGDFLLEIASGPTTNETASLPRANDFAEHFSQRGFTHVCFNVQDVDQALRQLNGSGVKTFSPAIDFPALSVRVGFVQDPDGNVIELKGPLAGDNIVKGKARFASNGSWD
ncbi:MAG: VOC family protein [Planctomycetota bacterium]